MPAPDAPSRGHRDLAEILVPPLVAIRWRTALRQFLIRAISRQYRATTLGFLWTLIVPLLTLGIYAFVFGVVMTSRWGDMGVAERPGGFVFYLFSGLMIFWLMAQTLNDSCGAIAQHANLVKKAVFPLEVIPVVSVGTGLFQALVNTALLLAAVLVFGEGIPVTVLLFPIVLAPFVLLLMGLAWFFAALGVFFRDLGQIVGLVMTGALFLSPVFYPMSRLSEGLQRAVLANPVTFIVLQTRRVLLEGAAPDWLGLGWYLLAAWIVASLGYSFFRMARRSFADVL